MNVTSALALSRKGELPIDAVAEEATLAQPKSIWTSAVANELRVPTEKSYGAPLGVSASSNSNRSRIFCGDELPMKSSATTAPVTRSSGPPDWANAVVPKQIAAVLKTSTFNNPAIALPLTKNDCKFTICMHVTLQSPS